MRFRPLAVGRLSIRRFGCMAISCSQQSGSSQSTRPSPSLSMQSPQISTGLVGDGVQSATTAWAQRPALQVSVVQALPSSQSDTVVQGSQPPIVSCAQRPALQLSVVQAVPSAPSVAVAPGLQPDTVSYSP